MPNKKNKGRFDATNQNIGALIVMGMKVLGLILPNSGIRANNLDRITSDSYTLCPPMNLGNAPW